MSYVEREHGELSQRLFDQLMALPHIRVKLSLLFATLSAVAGIVLAAGQNTEAIAVIAIFAAVMGFVFVDWLRVFHLPPIGAYLAMAGAAAYCVYDFWALQRRGEPQMTSVALLLVLVQGILMLQLKSRRILEQLAVFCLLELVVAAIFNDAFRFGLFLIPISVIGAIALSLLMVVTLMEEIDVLLDRHETTRPASRWRNFLIWISGRSTVKQQRSRLLATSSPQSVVSVYRSATAWASYAVLTLAPAVLVIALAFFYALPRKVKPTRSSLNGPTLVGFDDQIHLEQLGQVMQNSAIALKVKLTSGATDTPYRLGGSLYLRGMVLEDYAAETGTRPTAKWLSVDRALISRRTRLPEPIAINDNSVRTRFDDVQVTVTCEQMSSPSLFAVAPYHNDRRALHVVHSPDQWILSRDYRTQPFPRITYGFSTYAFSRGEQTEWIAQESPLNGFPEQGFSASGFSALKNMFGGASQSDTYYQHLLEFDRRGIPTASRLAEEILQQVPDAQRTQTGIAKAMEQYLATSPEFSYTLNLNAKPRANVDPIEQFLSGDRKGHCQYFASALALMLRSAGIPCRMVVGYRTEEYNNISHYYIARQQHAHAWVEALINRDQVPPQRMISGQPLTDAYWLRLDPTPGVSLLDDGNQTGVRGLLDTANNLWDDYVVEMDGQRQSDDLVQATGLQQVQDSYRSFFDRIERNLSGGGGQLAGSNPFEGLASLLPVPLLAIFSFVALAIAVRWYLLRKRVSDAAEAQTTPIAATPTDAFYRETLEQLERIGVTRRHHETPDELCRRVDSDWVPLMQLTQAFVHRRYGNTQSANTESLRIALQDLTREIDHRVASASE